MARNYPGLDAPVVPSFFKWKISPFINSHRITDDDRVKCACTLISIYAPDCNFAKSVITAVIVQHPLHHLTWPPFIYTALRAIFSAFMKKFIKY